MVPSGGGDEATASSPLVGSTRSLSLVTESEVKLTADSASLPILPSLLGV
jgi:hypothetical protein